MANKLPHYTYAIGRRKKSTAAVKLFTASPAIVAKFTSTVNKIPAVKYFPLSVYQQIFNTPFVVTDTVKKHYFQVKLSGGGKKGQVQALALALSRALQIEDSSLRPALKKAGLLTVDSRRKQRRMVGTGGKARRQKQSPKR